MKNQFDIPNYIKNFDSLPNAYIAYINILTIPVTVALAEKKLSKLIIVENYVRSRMSQEILNELATLSIEKELVNEINFNYVIKILH